MSNCNAVKIDAEKIEKMISEKWGGTKTSLSRELGYSDGYLNGIISKKRRMSKPALKLLCQKLNVPEEYLKAQPEKEKKQNETKEPEQEYVQLSNIESLLCGILAELKIMNKDRDLLAAILVELKKFNG